VPKAKTTILCPIIIGLSIFYFLYVTGNAGFHFLNESGLWFYSAKPAIINVTSIIFLKLLFFCSFKLRLNPGMKIIDLLP
jgi:hypothetical protein